MSKAWEVHSREKIEEYVNLLVLLTKSLQDEAIEVGDRIYATMLYPPPIEAEIQASQTTYQ